MGVASATEDVVEICAVGSRSFAQARHRSDEVIAVRATRDRWRELAAEALALRRRS